MSENGQLASSELAPIQNGELRIDAAAAWNAMNVQARALGCELRPTGSKSSYRTYAQQVELYGAYLNGTGNLAAKPGTSNHGWGLAVDVASQDMRAMIDRIGERYGWAKKWSDAPTEWWHIKWRERSWSGDDPGPYGRDRPQRIEIEEADVIVALVKNNGAIEVFVEKANSGEVFHTWQKGENQGWAGSEPGKNAAWYSLGTPGK